jgi:hypothetical protein
MIDIKRNALPLLASAPLGLGKMEQKEKESEPLEPLVKPESKDLQELNLLSQ